MLTPRLRYVMDRVRIELKNCYGIKELKQEFDFHEKRAYALYAPNGAMKSSLARTFKDVVDGNPSSDEIFPTRPNTRSILDENGAEIGPEKILVVLPYDRELSTTEKTATLLVDAERRSQYTALLRDVEDAKQKLLDAIKKQSGSKKNLEQEISSAFLPTNDELLKALTRIKAELKGLKETPFATVEYDRIFDEKVLVALNTNDLKSTIEGYVRRYNELLEKSRFFKKGTFDYYNAGEIAKTLTKNGFFDAKHTVVLNGAGEKIEISTEKELEEIITEEKNAILQDKKLKKEFDAVAKQLGRNANLRDFEDYMMRNEALLSQLTNLQGFKEDIIKSYLKANEDLYSDLMQKHEASEERKRKIEEEARKQQTQWEKVIEIFNGRFVVPFILYAKNKEAVMLGHAQNIELGFTYWDGLANAELDRPALLKSLSTGEARAYYILNVLFEVETRKKDKQETIILVDDIADSFDYQNKYAIIQYLKEISEDGLFKQIIMTHNFDFFRTIESRFVGYANCLMATRGEKEIVLGQAEGIRNIFADWKRNFFSDPKKKIGAISFLRNLVEYTEGKGDPKYVKLTSLLHWKADTETITISDLDDIYKGICKKGDTSPDGMKPVWKLIEEQAQACLNAPPGVNLENKVVLAIATRLAAERFMVKKINDPAFVAALKDSQTGKLAEKFEGANPSEKETAIIGRVLLMTPENIHLNSFMYEPLVDMSDDALKRLYKDVTGLE